MDDELTAALRIHGYTFSSDSDSYSSDYDSEDEYILSLRPPPLLISELEDRIVTVPAIHKSNSWERCNEESFQVQSDKHSGSNVSHLDQSKSILINDHNNLRQTTHFKSPWKNISSESAISNNIAHDSLKEFPPLPSKEVRNTENKENENNVIVKNINSQALKQQTKHSNNNAPKYLSVQKNKQNEILPTPRVFKVPVNNTQLIENRNKSLNHAKRKTDIRIISNNIINILEESGDKPSNNFSKRINKYSNVCSKTNLTQDVEFHYKQMTDLKGATKSTIKSSELSRNVMHVEAQTPNDEQTPQDISKRMGKSANSKVKKSNYKIKDMATTSNKSRKISNEKNCNKMKQQKSKNNSPKANEALEISDECLCNKNKLSITENRSFSRNNAVHHLIRRAKGIKSKRIIAKSRRTYDVTMITNLLIILSIGFIILIFYGMHKIICLRSVSL
ncbi:hypothetical protein ILUMI_02750 [Ignelater luminosus]|uniref:Uncharacterized protein n=1 Tax=Ignelater luminosus TaxID=2038154 RepID=A0A8K0DCV2_IGNLU|nr:hypothetical protein ILUMI_02750 [Ignelater luminosus]